jgi:hypothetical protein
VRHDATAVSAVMLGLPGFVVVAAAEVGGKLELVVETTGTVTGCPDVVWWPPRMAVQIIWFATSRPRVGRCCCCGASGSGAAMTLAA